MSNRNTNWIAGREVTFIKPDGRKTPGRIAIGEPEEVSGVEARCAVLLEGLDPVHEARGDSTLQALALALRLAGRRLHDFCSSGGRVEYPDHEGGGDVDLDALLGPVYSG